MHRPGDCSGRLLAPNRTVPERRPAIGGYFELELNAGAEYHPDALRLNTGRNAFEYILRARQYKKVYLPYYTCDVMLEPIRKLGIEHQFYHVDADLSPCFDYSIVEENHGFVYTNYFGVRDRTVEAVAQACPNLIIDNAQAFFAKPVAGADVFYSPRKFFGVPDGAYLYTDEILPEPLERDHSDHRFEHLLLRTEYGPEAGYGAFLNHRRSLVGLPIKAMSNLTQQLLQNINYAAIAERRRANFRLLHEALGSRNNLHLDLTDAGVPMVYPFYPDGGGAELRQHLIDNRIYVAQYWPNVLEWTKAADPERAYALGIVPLPVDQRYCADDMKRITAVIEAWRSGGA